MRLEVRAHAVRLRRRHGGVAVVADVAQGLAPADTIPVLLRQRMLQREGAGIHARAHHHRHEARPLFIGPYRQFQRRLGLHPGVVQRAQHLQASQHAVIAVEFSAGGLGVDMAARHDHGQAVVAAWPAREDIADGVDAHLTARVHRPIDEQVPALPVQVGQRQPAHAAFLGAADASQVHQGLP
ncbi:hypothetical protein G6F40_015159 [Rhizopus arrhizus]|nr:hypothetical protein G6F40_015159 [Rhizopus arrhizus]